MRNFRFTTVLIIILVFINIVCSTNECIPRFYIATASNNNKRTGQVLLGLLIKLMVDGQRDGKKSILLQTRSKGNLRFLVADEKSKLTYRDQDQHIDKNCEGSDLNTVQLTIIYNEPLGLSVTVNDTSKTAYLIDYKDDVGLLLNGQNCVGILIDHNSSLAYKLDGVWNASKEPISEFFQGVTSLKSLLETAKQNGGETPLANPSKAIEGEIVRDITNLAGSYHPKDIENYFGRTMTVHLRGHLKVFYKGTGSLEINKDLRTQVKLNLALADWLTAADDVDSIGTLDAGYIFSSKTGLAILLNFLEQVDERADMAKVFRTLLTSQQAKFFRLVTEIEKAVSYEGIDGFDIVLADFVLLLSGKGTLKETFNDLLKYTPNDDLNLTVMSCYIDRMETILRKSLDKYNNHDVLGWLYDFVVNKTTGKLIIFNVNIADLVSLLTARNLGQVIHKGVKVLTQLLSPQNIPAILQWLLTKDNEPDFLSLFFSNSRIE